APGCIYSQEEIDAILFPPDENKAFRTDTTSDIHREIKRLKKRQIDLELHGQMLSEYYRTKKIPRGFRIKNPPSDATSVNSVRSEVKVQLCQVNRELSTRIVPIQDNDAFANALHNIDSEILAYSEKQKQVKRDKLRLVNQDYQEGRVYPWVTGATRPRRRLCPRTDTTRRHNRPPTSESDHPTENPSSDSEAGIATGATSSVNAAHQTLFPKVSGNADPGGASREQTVPPLRNSGRRGSRRAR
ncbi:hypothetical protein AB205_0208000, partial [Aquarana catesbeiana]